MGKLEQILAFMKPIIEKGQTSIIITMLAIVALSAFAYYDNDNSVYYGAGIVIVAVVFMIVHAIEGRKNG